MQARGPRGFNVSRKASGALVLLLSCGTIWLAWQFVMDEENSSSIWVAISLACQTCVWWWVFLVDCRRAREPLTVLPPAGDSSPRGRLVLRRPDEDVASSNWTRVTVDGVAVARLPVSTEHVVEVDAGARFVRADLGSYRSRPTEVLVPAAGTVAVEVICSPSRWRRLRHPRSALEISVMADATPTAEAPRPDLADRLFEG